MRRSKIPNLAGWVLDFLNFFYFFTDICMYNMNVVGKRVVLVLVLQPDNDRLISQ